MFSSIIFLSSWIVSVMANRLCFVEDKPKGILPEPNNPQPNYRVISCKKNEDCCDEGCCIAKESPEILLKMGYAGIKLSPFIWILLILIFAGYVYFCVHFCVKRITKKRNRERSVEINRTNTQPQELNLMLSFNQNHEGLERFNFENTSGAHLHVPFIPTTPVTPPPAYVTLTPPPTYNVAIHFPSVCQNSKNLEQEDNDAEIKN